jgi:hypothetical protein
LCLAECILPFSWPAAIQECLCGFFSFSLSVQIYQKSFHVPFILRKHSLFLSAAYTMSCTENTAYCILYPRLILANTFPSVLYCTVLYSTVQFVPRYLSYVLSIFITFNLSTALYLKNKSFSCLVLEKLTKYLCWRIF